MNEEFMTITDAEGNEHRCKILFTYFSDEFKHNYVVFNVEGTDEISAMIFTETSESAGSLMPIENDDEWDMLEEVVTSYFEQQEHHHHCDCGCCCGEEGECDCDGDCDCHDEECSCGCNE